MGSPKKSKDQASSLNKALISNEIHNSNLTASLSLGNAQRKSWMSSSQTPFIKKVNPPRPTAVRVKAPKPRETQRPPQAIQSSIIDQGSIAQGSVHTQGEIELEIDEPKSKPLPEMQLVQNTSSPSEPTASAPDNPIASPRSEELPDVTTQTRKSPEAVLDQLQNPIEIDSDNSADEAQVESMANNPNGSSADTNGVLQVTSAEDSRIEEPTVPCAASDEVTHVVDLPTSHAISVETPAAIGATVRRPSSLLIPPIRRASLDLGRTPPSTSSEAQSPFDYSVAPTPPMATSPAITQSPASWSGGNLKRVSDAHYDSESARKRHQPPAASQGDPGFWENLNTAHKSQSQSSRSNVERLMIQCHTGITEKLASRSQFVTRGVIEQPRFELLRKACRLHDYSFLMIHQLFCYSGIATLNPTASRLTAEDRKALSILNTFLASNSDLHQDMVIWFSQFPGTSPAVISETPPSSDLDSWYRAALSTVHGIAARWAGVGGLHGSCTARRFPPLISEMQNAMNVFSRVLQEVIFTAMLRNLMSPQDPRFARHEAVFQRDLQISWGLGGDSVGNGLSCVDEHRQISLSNFQISGPIANGRSMSTSMLNSSASRSASVDNVQLPNQDSAEAFQHNPQTLTYNPQALWPRTAHFDSTSPQSPSFRRYSSQIPISTLPSNDSIDERSAINRQRQQSLWDTPPSSPAFFRDALSEAPQQQSSGASPFTFVTQSGHSNRSLPLGASVGNQVPAPLQISQSRPVASQTSPMAVNNTFINQYGLLPSTSSMITRNQMISNWQHYGENTAPGLRTSTHQHRPNAQRVVSVQQNGSSQMASGKTRDLSPKIDTGTHEKCFRYVKSIYKPADVLNASKTQYQQIVNLAQSESEKRARQIMMKGANTQLLYPGTLTFRVRCLKVMSKKIIRSDEDWVCAEQHWPNSIAILVNEVPLTIQRKSAHGKDLPVDITTLVRGGINTISVATFNMPRNSPDQYLVGIEAIETVTYTQIKNYVQALPLEAAKRRITSKMGNDDPDIEVLDPSITVDLTDPFSSIIFMTPARGVGCSHDQCFDLDTFLSTRMGSGGSKNGPCHPEEFKCPICKGDARPSKIVVDDFLRLIRARLEQMDRLDVKAIKIDIDGNWVIKEEAAPADEDDDSEVNGRTGLTSPTSGAPHRSSTSVQPSVPASSSRQIEIIDLD